SRATPTSCRAAKARADRHPPATVGTPRPSPGPGTCTAALPGRRCRFRCDAGQQGNPMPSIRLVAAAVTLALSGAAAVDAAAPQAATQTDAGDAIWIVELAGQPLARRLAGPQAAKAGDAGGLALARAEFGAELARARASHLAEAEALLGRSLHPLATYQHASNGLALRLDSDEARQLATLPGVRRVSRDRRFRLATDRGPAFIGAPAIWNAAFGTGTRGEGIVVGVIDTGINATHPSFAAVGPVDGHVHANPRGRRYGLCASGGGGCNDKLIGIYD